MQRSKLGRNKPSNSKNNNNSLCPRPKSRKEVRVEAPVSGAIVRTMADPSFSNSSSKNGDIVIRHREYMTDINGSTSFNLGSLSINPGLYSSFPWLSGLARRYESYRFRRLDFCFETESPTNQIGTVMLAIDYDAADVPPTSKLQMMSYRGSVRGPPWSSFRFSALKEDLSKRSTYFVRAGGVSSSDDVRLYDVGVLYAATQGQASVSTLGELYVEYEIELMTPQLSSAAGLDVQSATFYGTVNTNMFGLYPQSGWPGNSLGITYTPSGSTGSIWTFQQPFEGFWAISVTGVGLSTISIGGTGSEHELSEVIESTTEAISVGYVRAQAGNTFIVTVPNTSISSAEAWFTEMNVPQTPQPSLFSRFKSKTTVVIPGKDTEVFHHSSNLGRTPGEGYVRGRCS